MARSPEWAGEEGYGRGWRRWCLLALVCAVAVYVTMLRAGGTTMELLVTGDEEIDGPGAQRAYVAWAHALRGLGAIPKLIHTSLPRKIPVLNSSLALLHAGVGALARLNADWEVVVHDDDDVLSQLRRSLPAADFDLVKNTHPVERTDLWRLMVMYERGGVYLDVDRLANVRLADVLNPATRCALPVFTGFVAGRGSRPFDFAQDLMISAPGNPIFAEAVRMNVRRRRTCHLSGAADEPDAKLGFKCAGVGGFGPTTYMHAVTLVLFGRSFPTNPDPGRRHAILRRLEELHPLVVTYSERAPTDTFLLRLQPGESILGVRWPGPRPGLNETSSSVAAGTSKAQRAQARQAIVEALAQAKKELYCVQGVSTLWTGSKVSACRHGAG